MNIENFISNHREKECIDTFKYFEGFAGIGSQALAFERLEDSLGIKFECVGIAEIDEDAIKAYETLHGPVNNYGDVNDIDYSKLPHIDGLTWSSPCEDNSIAGQRKGMDKNSGTKSSLAWKLIDLLDAKRKVDDLPSFILFENVKGITQGKIKKEFNMFLDAIRAYGYTISSTILDANEFECAQHRERCFCMCTIKNIGYAFPSGRENKVYLRDILDKDVSREYDYNSNNPINASLYKPNSHTLRIHNPSFCTKGYTLTCHGGGRLDDNYFFRFDISENPVIRVNERFLKKNGINVDLIKSTPIRKITPNEAMKLMSLNDDEIIRLNCANFPKTTMYRLLGGSICVNVLEDILRNYFEIILQKTN